MATNGLPRFRRDYRLDQIDQSFAGLTSVVSTDRGWALLKQDGTPGAASSLPPLWLDDLGYHLVQVSCLNDRPPVVSVRDMVDNLREQIAFKSSELVRDSSA